MPHFVLAEKRRKKSKEVPLTLDSCLSECKGKPLANDVKLWTKTVQIWPVG
jgi:hypothetical protein